MKKNVVFLRLIRLAFCFLLMMLSSCSPEKSSKSTVSIDLSKFSSNRVETATACTDCLVVFSIRISGEGMETIRSEKQVSSPQEIGTELTGTIDLTVPAGSARKVEVVAVYINSTGMQIQYGSQTIEIKNGANDVNVSLASQGYFRQGSISGRYLTGANTGPTGLVSVKIVPFPGFPAFTIYKTPIINGWFDFIGSENFGMTYETDTQTIFNNVKLSDFTPNAQIARVHMPTTSFKNINSVWTPFTNDNNDVVIGYFFAPVVSDATKKVCRGTSTSTLSNLAEDASGSMTYSYDPTGASTGTGFVYVNGGVDETTCGAYVQNFGLDNIFLRADQFDGTDIENSRAKQGAFSQFFASSKMNKFSVTSNTYTVKALPGLFSTGDFDGVNLYSLPIAPPMTDPFTCDADLLALAGFSQVGLTGGITTSGDEISLTTSSPVAGGTALYLCPSLAGSLKGYGGFYMGQTAAAAPPPPPPSTPAVLVIKDGVSVVASYNFGSVTSSTTATKTLTVENTGGLQATAVGGTGLALPFDFDGGSFPGTGGTCGGIIPASTSCTIVLSFNPLVAGAASSTLSLDYSDTGGTYSTTLNLMGTGL